MKSPHDDDQTTIVNVLDLAVPRGTVVRRAPSPQSNKTSRGRKSTAATETGTGAFAEVDRKRVDGEAAAALRRSFSEVLIDSRDGANANVTVTKDRRHFRRSSTASTASLDTIAQDKSPVVITIAATGCSSAPQDERRRCVAKPRAAESSDEQQPKAQDERRRCVAKPRAAESSVEQDERRRVAKPRAAKSSDEQQPKAQYERHIIITTPLPPARLAGHASATANFVTASSLATFYTSPSQPDAADDLDATSRGNDDDDDRRPGGNAGGRAFPRPRKCTLWTRSKELVTGCFVCAGRRMCFCEGF